MLDILIKNATIVDGTGSLAYEGCVGIIGDKIALLTKGNCSEDANDVVDGKGLLCCPGFIDIHNHADISIPFTPQMYNFLSQGITTLVAGNCGISIAPTTNPSFTQSYFSSIGLADMNVTWESFAQWLDTVRAKPLGANYIPLVGHNAIRGCALGSTYNRPSTEAEIETEACLLGEALSAGAFGMSMSFDAGVPGHYAQRKELDRLFGLLEDHNSMLTAHTRHHQNQWPSEDKRSYYGVYNGYKGDVLCGRYHGLLEFAQYYRRFKKLRTVISHLTNAFLMPQPHSQALENAMIDETVKLFVDDPIAEGCDVYYNLLPSEISISSAFRVTDNLSRSMIYDDSFQAYADETALVGKLSDTTFRTAFKSFINSGRFKMGMLSPATDAYWSDAFTFVKSTAQDVVGKTLMEITMQRKPGAHEEMLYENCLDVLFDLVLEDPLIEWALTRDKRECMAYERLLLHPKSMPCTDVIAFPQTPDTSRNILSYGTPPTAYSMFCRYLVNLSRDTGYLPMEEAIRKITSLPADVMRLDGRGRLLEGNYADITILDWQNLRYFDDFTQPALCPEGIVHVLVNGRFAMRDSIINDVAAGRVLTR